MEAKPCPFCGVVPADYQAKYFCCTNDDCVTEIEEVPLADWNTRPIEDAQAARIADLEAEIAALRPWARIGKRAIAEHWHVVDITGDGWINHLRCCGAQAWGETDAVHAPDCPIPALLAQLEAADA